MFGKIITDRTDSPDRNSLHSVKSIAVQISTSAHKRHFATAVLQYRKVITNYPQLGLILFLPDSMNVKSIWVSTEGLSTQHYVRCLQQHIIDIRNIPELTENTDAFKVQEKS